MRLNRMTDYALRVIRALYTGETDVITSTVLSEKEHIPRGVLMKVLNKLRANHIVESHQGRGSISGGFSLVKGPDQITLLEIIEIMEGSILINMCLDDKENCYCKGVCKVHQEFFRLNTLLRDELSKKTLYEILVEPEVSNK